MSTNETFSKGDLVTHKCSPGDMKARFSGYKSSHPSEEQKVFVKYTEGRRKGCEGEWLEKYCMYQAKTETKCGHISDPVAGGKITLTPEQKEVVHEENHIANKAPTAAEVGNGNNFIQEAYARMRGSSITGRRATHVIFDELEDKPHAEIRDESFEEIHNDTAWGDYYDSMKRMKRKEEKADWYKKMYSCDFSELEKHAMADMAPKQKHYGFVDTANYAKIYLTKETPMKETITEIYTDGDLTQTLIGDQDVETMSATDMLQAIGNVNNAIEKLNKHDMSSSYVANRTAKLNKFVKLVYKILDEKFGK